MGDSFNAHYSIIYTTTTAPLRSHSQLIASMTLMDFAMEDVGEVSAINILIDSSIDIAGNNNTVLLPSTAGSVASADVAPSEESDDGTASLTTAASTGQMRAATIGPLAATIIAALKQAGGLSDAMGRALARFRLPSAWACVLGVNNSVISTAESAPGGGLYPLAQCRGWYEATGRIGVYLRSRGHEAGRHLC